ncbi:MAG: type VI secretion system baseplate subunit TssF [Verrucomicrobia bacterium]|nr:type VI secretion system baseplate subunit TssF [Verrucomicrobiota bacterium]MBV8483141.1 type VI secretion system baseplate subunit TssF [Verrucomicrobiota bacterium]
MDERLVAYYNSELRHLREMAGEFAREFPKIAGRLALDRDAKEICPDPYVERLLEGFAFLAARVHLKLDAEFPRFTQTLLETVYPHYLAPVPAMGIAHFEPDPREPGPEDGFLLERGTALRSVDQETRCQFRTSHDLRLWPLRITESRYYTRDIVALELPAALGAKAGIFIRLQTNAGRKLEELKLDRLPIFIRGSDEIPISIYEQIFTRASHVILQTTKGSRQFREILPASTIRRVGFEEDEAILPNGPRSFEGYRLLKEYFACPQRFLFFELTGLTQAVQRSDSDRLEIIIALRAPEPRLDNRIDASTFALFCTPIINLFRKRLDPILISDRFSEFHIVPERTRPIEFEVYQIEEVAGVTADSNQEQRFEPFYRARSEGDHSGAYYTVHRAPRVLTAKEKKFGAVSSYAGSEVFISLVDAKSAPYPRRLSQLNSTALCTNRHLPLQSPISIGETDMTTELYAPVTSIRWLVGPTIPVASTGQGDPSWRVISHLSLNYLSLLDAKDGEGAAPLRELLKLYVNPNDLFTLRQIDGIRSAVSNPIIRRVDVPGPLTFARGLEIKVIMDESAFEGSGIFVLGAVLAQFFARYVSINSFTETVIVSQRRGEIMRWPSLIGKRQII